MVRVQRLDVSRDVLGPIVYYRSVAGTAAGLVCELPCKNGARGLIAIDDELDVLLVSGLGSHISVERSMSSPKSIRIGVNASQIIEVIEQW